MTQFLRLLKEEDKGAALASTTAHVRSGAEDSRHFEVDPASFEVVPGAPFAYWVSNRVRETFQRLPAFEDTGRAAEHGVSTKDDFRFLREWWEVVTDNQGWFPFAKGGAYSPFYADVYLVVNWRTNARELEAALLKKYPYLGDDANWVLHRECHYFHPGVTWPRRTQRFGPRVLPGECIFADKGCAAFSVNDDPAQNLSTLSIMASRPFGGLVELKLNAGDATARSYEVGIIQSTPVPELTGGQQSHLSSLSLRAWSLKRTLDTVTETSHAFLLPTFLRPLLGPFGPPAIEAELARIQQEIDDICFDLYGFDEADRAAMTETTVSADEGTAAEEDAGQEDAEDTDEEISADAQPALLSWCVGVAFGRFDICLATGERTMSPEPGSFDPLPAKSPGMLPDGVEPFHTHAGILVDDKGDPHDLPHLVEEVLEKVDMPVSSDVRDWLQHDFFAFHLQHYSKSRRKAPIYWPLSTRSGVYTLWVYYPSLTDQTLYTAVNDFVEPKLKQVIAQATMLNARGPNRTRDEEKKLEELQNMEDELTDLRDALLKIAPTYHPDQDDGVQITTAPLWPLFRHKPWQKLLKETWTKLEKGDYDWAHLAMDYWPDRVRAKCTTDKSLAIAHGLEDLYVEPEIQARKTRTRRQ